MSRIHSNTADLDRVVQGRAQLLKCLSKVELLDTSCFILEEGKLHIIGMKISRTTRANEPTSLRPRLPVLRWQPRLEIVVIDIFHTGSPPRAGIDERMIDTVAPSPCSLYFIYITSPHWYYATARTRRESGKI